MNSTPTPEAPLQPAPEVQTTSLLSRLFNVFATPGDVFQEVKASPACTANWVVPAILVMLVGWLGTWLIFSQATISQQILDMQHKAVQEMVEKGKLKQEQADAQKAAMEKFGLIGAKISAGVVPLFSGLVVPFWYGLFIWLAGSKAMGAAFPFMKAVEVAGLVNMISVLEGVIKTLLIIILGNIFAGPNLGLFVLNQFDQKNVLHGVLVAIDIMTLWQLLARSSGLAALAGCSFGKAAAWMFGLWILVTGCLMGIGVALTKIFS